MSTGTPYTSIWASNVVDGGNETGMFCAEIRRNVSLIALL
jgi:hypothetical protein